MKSFIKILGPPFLDSIIELEKIAVDMPQVCIMDSVISREIPAILAEDVGGRVVNTSRFASAVGHYYRSRDVMITKERCSNIISSSGDQLGDYDFFFEWNTKPTFIQLNNLIEKIDKALEPLGCYYSITTIL